MARIRIAFVTACVLAVMPAVPNLTPRAPGGALAFAGEPAQVDVLAVDRALRRILRTNLPLGERLAAAAEVLETVEAADGDALVRAGLALLPEAPRAGAWLLLAGTDRTWPEVGLRERARETIRALLEDREAGDDRAQVWTAAGVLVGLWPDDMAQVMIGSWPTPEVVRAVLRRHLALPEGVLDAQDGRETTRTAIQNQLPAARALEQAVDIDPETMKAGLDTLRGLRSRALPFLLAEARRAAAGVPPGRLPRALRTVLALGLMGNREATPVLVQCLEAPDGWLQVAAATALGDLGDPSAAIPLCHKLTYRGEIYRPRDQWDFPGERETTVAREDWRSIEYFVIDGAAADALIRLGAPGAIEWLIRNQLDPGKSNFRVRVMQDAVDALHRAVPDAPVAAYNVDAGLPQRRAAYEALLAWWGSHAFDHDVLGRRLDADDEGFRLEARRMVERLRGRSIMELQISHETCAILGPAVTPTLLETLAVTKNRVLKTEIARALGAVRDVRAVPALLELLGDRAAFVRAVAAESLGAYARRAEGVEKALFARLQDPEAAPRVAALAQIVRLPPTPAVQQLLTVHTPESHRDRFGSDDRDYRMGWTVAMLVQHGSEHWPAVRTGLSSSERYLRRAWWDLVRRALGLETHVYDPYPDPGTQDWKPVDEATILEALTRRRSS